MTPTLLIITLAVAAFLGLSYLDTAAGNAAMRETRGLVRGPIVDRAGLPLAFTTDQDHRAQRHYATGGLLPVLGYQDPSGRWHGLEARYDRALDAVRARRDWRTFFLHLTGKSTQGDTLQLTVDRRMQEVATQDLRSHPGAVVALDPSTGAVLAMATSPSCAAQLPMSPASYRECRQSKTHLLQNRATEVAVPPGSTFKIVTLTAALDTGRFTLASLFSGADVFGPSPYFDGTEYPSNVTRPDLKQLTLAQALAFSDNFTFAHVGLTLGASTLLKYAHRFYLGRSIPFDLPVTRSSVASGQSHPSASIVARSSFGASTDRVTVLQMAMIAAAVANHGVLMAPHLVKAVTAPNGKVLWRAHTRRLDRVMSAKTADAVTAGMIFVVDHGSGWPAQIAGMKVAGKTGTAASGGDRPHAWFIAFAPAEHPVAAVAVLCEYSGEGYKYAAPIARSVLVTSLREHGYKVH